MAKQATPKPAPTDSFTAGGAAIAYAILGTITLAIRASHHQTAALTIGLPLGAVGVFAIFDYLEGPRRRLVGLAVGLDLTICTWIIWPAHPPVSWLLPVALPAFGAWIIGHRATKKQDAAKLRTLVTALMKPGAPKSKAVALIHKMSQVEGPSRAPLLPVGAKYEDHKFNADTSTISIWFNTQQKTPADTARNIAGALSRASTLVHVQDLHEQRAGLFKLMIHESKLFGFTMPAIPPVEEWPNDSYPLGVDGLRKITYAPCNANSYTAGETGSGKTDAMLNRAYAAIALGRQLVCIDLKRVDFVAVAPHCEIHADSPNDALRALASVAELKDARLEWMVKNGHREWPGGPDHPYVDLLVDECADLFNDRKVGKVAIELAEDIAARGRAAGIFSHWATQHPTTDSLPRIVKVNTPATIGLRVQDGNAARAVAGEDSQREGFDLSPKGRLPVGRACFISPGSGRRWVQLFKAPDRPPHPPTRSATSGAPLPPPAQPNGNGGSQPATSPYPGQTPLPEASDTSDRNPQSEADGTDLDDAIAQLLAPINPATQTPIGRVLGALDGMARSTKAVGESVGISERQALTHLNNLATDGLALRVKGGWIRA